MILERSDLILILPLSWRREKEGEEIFGGWFTRDRVSESSQLFGSPLAGEHSDLVKVFRLNHGRRQDIGLHVSVKRHCQVKRCADDIEIGRIRLWLFDDGAGFVTLEVHTGPIRGDAFLDLAARLSNVLKRTPVEYRVQTGRDTFESRVFTLAGMLDVLRRLPSEIRLEPEKQAYKKALCLSYCAGTTDGPEDTARFLEILRHRLSSAQNPAHGLEEKYRYNPPFGYLTWAVSEGAAACFADLTSGEKNAQFLLGNGGLSQSVRANYLPVYLTVLSVQARLRAWQETWRVRDISALPECPAEGIAALRRILNTPLTALTAEPHINELFEDYVCGRALGLRERLDAFSGQLLKESSGERIRRMEQDIEEIRRNAEEIVARTRRIDTQMESLAGFVNNDLNRWVTEARRCVVLTGNADADEGSVAAFIQGCAGHINGEIGSLDDLAKQEQTSLQGRFGPVWERMAEETRASLVSAGVLWGSCSRMMSIDFDYSGICILATASLESELREVFFFGLQRYLERIWGAPDAERCEDTYAVWPERLLSLSRRDFEAKRSCGEKPVLRPGRVFTMGNLPYLLGRWDEKADPEQNRLMRRSMEAYLRSILKEEYREKPLRALYVEEDPASFAMRCEAVRSNFRNPAAHVQFIPRETAESCFRAVIGRGEAAAEDERKRGLILRLYGYLL